MTATAKGGSFYPEMIPADPDHPSEAAFEIVDLRDARGRGVVVRIGFAPGARLALLSGVVMPERSLNTIQIGPDLHMSDPWFCRFILHACDPNARFDLTDLTLIARRPIAPGDLLSVDYGATEDRLARQFECHCGATDCRGWMMGCKEKPTEEGRRVLAARGRRET
ncbi:MAG: SET domain-containing protein-lysine N-methyltransferase [Rhodospirillaceae bacterium]|jgi:uncharacterized protein|nr:SET domain-containing protein-lysine N-methyltransferase [Rhodospirillaceae bacterium]MBT6116465.1 SET domain-containing protein-lysine N-methyltransferase [Rhodospirillaceae bacterium]